jgi:hypothetical protein
MRSGGPAVWTVMIEENGTLEIVGLNQFDWQAFAEIPDFFDFLAEKAMAFQRMNDELHTLDGIERWLIERNYKRHQ